MNAALVKRVALGTAQFGSNYGIANAHGKVPSAEVAEILQYAAKEGIRTLDTAYAYGDSEQVLGESLAEQPGLFRVVTKLPQLKEPGAQDEIEKIVKDSLERLRIDRIYGCLIHHFPDFLQRPQVWNVLQELKKQKTVEKIGFSLYHVHELEELLSRNVSFDLLQVPYSIFDRRFERYFSQLKEKKVEIHVRSIFLQGLAFLNPEQLPAHLRNAQGQLTALRHLSESQQMTIQALCLNFVLLDSLVDKVVIGIDSLQQLKENLRDLCCYQQVEALRDQLEAVVIEDEDVVLPYRWSRR